MLNYCHKKEGSFCFFPPVLMYVFIVVGWYIQLRLSSKDKYSELVCQSIADRCILEKIYRFLVYTLPSSFPEESNRPVSRKRKTSAAQSDEMSAAFLTPAVSHSSIILSPHPQSAGDDSNWNYNLNNSNLFLKSFLNMRHGSRSSLTGSSPSPIHFDFIDRPPTPKMPLVGSDMPKIGRPRSKSTAERPKKKAGVHSRSRSIDPTSSPLPLQSNETTAILTAPGLGLNSNNNSNSASSSPTRLLRIPYASFRPLPVTPPRNPFEGSDPRLNPKTLKQLQRK